MVVQIVDGRVRFRYSAGGDGDSEVSLSAVNVSDGAWHSVHVERHGHWAALSLDHAEAHFANHSLPPATSRRGSGAAGRVGFRIAQRGVLAGADVRFPSATSAPLVNHDLVDSK